MKKEVENENKLLSKKNIIIVVVIFLILILLAIAIILINNANTLKLEKELKQKNYIEANKIIQEKKLIDNKRIIELIDEEIATNKITTAEELLNLSSDDWQNIENLYNFVNLNKIKVKNESYLIAITNIKQNYGEYFDAIRWYKNSESEEISKAYEINGDDRTEINRAIKEIDNYSFEKYNADSTYIKDIIQNNKKISNAYRKILKALDNSDSDLLEDAKSEAIDAITDMASTEISIILISGKFEEAIKALPNI